MDKPICTVSGMPQRGRFCPNIVVGMRHCSAPQGSCHLQAERVIEPGDVVFFFGVAYRVIALGDYTGTLDIVPHPDGTAGDRFRNVPASQLKLPAQKVGD